MTVACSASTVLAWNQFGESHEFVKVVSTRRCRASLNGVPPEIGNKGMKRKSEGIWEIRQGENGEHEDNGGGIVGHI